MPLSSIHNRKGFFSDYWLGTLSAARGATGLRLTAAQARKAVDRLRRAVDAVDSVEAPELSRLREKLARPLFEEVLGFTLKEGGAEPRLRPLAAANGDEPSTAALAWLLPEADEIDSPRVRRAIEDALLSAQLDYGFIVSPQTLRLVRNPRAGNRGAALDVSLASIVETEDAESLSAAYRVLAAQNFVAGPDGKRPIEVLEAESRRHSARVSEDLKQAVFEAAEAIVGGFLRDARNRPDAFASAPTLAQLRDAGFLALYRLLFILYAEARDERLIAHPLYQRSYSLDSLVTRVLATPLERQPANNYRLWAQLQALFTIFNEGIEPHLPHFANIPPRGGRLFSEETPEGKLLLDLRLDDRTAAALLLPLATTRPRRGVGRERVSFRELEIEQLGHVYEGLLEYEPGEAKALMVEVNIAGRELALTPEEIVRACELKQLHLRGEPALVDGTAAASLHPELSTENEDEETGEEEEEETESSDDADEEEPAIKRGAALKLLRRIEPGEFFFKPGAARKSSGSYYTPTAMVDDLARHALGPLVEGRSAADIERLRVIDIACGSGHFLVGAARFLGPKLFEAYKRSLGGKPPPEFHPDRALSGEVTARWEGEGRDWCRRRIVERCLFGVDLNPAAVQLAQVALWIESLAGDRPLSFFAHHIRCGNSLLGSSLARFDTPPDPQLGKPGDRMTRGLFETELRRKLDEALAERRLIDAPLPPEIRADTPEEYAYKEDRLRRADAAIVQAKLLLGLRSASPFLPVIWKELPLLMSSFDLENDARQRPWWKDFAEIRARERFFHWELEFPEVFLDAERPGFDAVLGNPPWDKVLPSKHEFYGQVDALIRAYKGNELKRRIAELNAAHDGLADRFDAYTTRATTFARVLRGSGDFPLAEARSQAAHEDVAKYFVDRALALTAKKGAAGLVVPSVFYNGDGWVGIRRYLLNEATVERFYGFENRRKVFPIDSRYKFVNLVTRKDATNAGRFTATFMRHDLDELLEASPKPWHVQITREEIEDLSPDTLAFLEYRNRRDQEIVEKMAAGRPTLGNTGPGSWGASLITDLAHITVYNSARDKDLFADPSTGKVSNPQSILDKPVSDVDEAISGMKDRGFLPVFEGKQIDQYVLGTKPIRWWLSVAQAEKKYGKRPVSQSRLAMRRIASNTNERTAIAVVLPPDSASSEQLPVLGLGNVEPAHAIQVVNSLCFDFLLRLRSAGTTLAFTYLRSVPVPSVEVLKTIPTIETRIGWREGLEHITDDVHAWESLWSAERAVAEAYGLTREDFVHVLGSFPVLARKRPKFMQFLMEKASDW